MADIETSDDFGARLCARVWGAMAGDLAVNEVCAMVGKLIETDRAAVANAVLDEYMALVNEKVMAAKPRGRLDCFRNAYAELRAKYAAKGGG